MQLSQNEEIFCDFFLFYFFFLHLRNLDKIWNTFNKKISLRADFFLKLKTAKSGAS